MPIEHIETGHQISDEVAQEMIRLTIERTGKFVLSAPEKPELGEVRDYAGLPMRAIRYVSFLEAKNHAIATSDIWKGDYVDEEDYYFEVEVAD